MSTPAQVLRAIRTVVEGTPALLARDEVTCGQAVDLIFANSLEEDCNTLRKYIGTVTKTLTVATIQKLTGSFEDDRAKANAINGLFAMRALHTLATSRQTIANTSFETRTFWADEAIEALGVVTTGDSRKVRDLLQDTACVFQFCRKPSDTEPWLYSWGLMVDGISISRGTAQPIHKLVSGLIKLVNVASGNSAPINTAVAKLAAMKNPVERYYMYLSNQNSAQHYQDFYTYRNVTSCMAKEHAFYSRTGEEQHPMDCYDGSPDWSLMFLSKQSPEEILAMCDLLESNPDYFDVQFEYPWLTRAFVLPLSKESSGRLSNLVGRVPYVWGKFYGDTKLVNHLHTDDNEQAFIKNDNPLGATSYYISGGRIKAIPSTNADYPNYYLLPYFDRANTAKLVWDEAGTMWWESDGNATESDHNDPTARALYEYGTAKFVSAYSLAAGRRVSLNATSIEFIDTAFGRDLASMSNHYKEVTLSGQNLLIPSRYMYSSFNNGTVAYEDMVVLVGGQIAPRVEVEASPQRYVRIPGIGIFDTSAADMDNFVRVVQETTPTPAEAGETA